jgi:ribonuclease BN (tRNA processing enzyme)
MNVKRLSRRALLAGAGHRTLACPSIRRSFVAAVTPSKESWTLEAAEKRAKAALKNASGTKLVLLGTGGGPVPGMARRMTSNVMVSGGVAYVLDCGLGVTDQFARTGLSFAKIGSIFITHMHPDHTVEYGPLMLIGWIQGMRPDVQVFGPPPLRQMTDDYLHSQRTVVDFWAEDFALKPLRAIAAHEVTTEGRVMDDGNVRVTSVLVKHPPVHPAYGYRFDFHDRSIAFSGDTVALDAVARMAEGADVLVHEAMFLPAMDAIAYFASSRLSMSPKSFLHHMLVDHTRVEDVGRIATKAGVKTLILSHLTPGFGVPDQVWHAAAASTFKGEIIVGHDLAVI